MQINRVSDISYGSGLAKAAIISAMMAGSPAQAQEMKADTFEFTPKTEYVSEMSDLYDDVFVYENSDTLKRKDSRGEEFNNWVTNLINAADKNGKVDTSKMKSSVNFTLDKGESFTSLAESIVASCDKNGDNKIDFDEFSGKVLDSPNNKQKSFYDNLSAVFSAFDINESSSQKSNSKKTLDVKEVAANLLAVSEMDYSERKSGMYIDGQQLIDEMNFMLYHEKASPDFREAQEIIYENIK